MRIAFAERQVLSVNLNELRQKEVINTRDGRSLGRVVDIEFCVCDGRVTAIVVPGEFCFSAMLRGERTGVIIPWDKICKIGDDVILVDAQELCL